MSGIDSDIGPFTIVPQWLNKAVSPGAIAAWVAIGGYADANKECWPYRATLAADLECSVDTLDRRIKELTACGALIVTPQFDDRGDSTSNLYRMIYGQPCYRVPAPLRRPGSRADAAHKNQIQIMELESVIAGASADAAPDTSAPTAASFDAFWKLYPRKIGKPQAAKAYERAAKRASAEAVTAGLARWAPHWRAGELRFVPHPTTWLNRDGWDDELPGPPAARGRAPSVPSIDRDAPEGRVFL